MRVLVVNANRLERESQAKLIEAKQHRIDQASDCKSALSHLEKGFYETMFLDAALPGDGALDVLQRIRLMPALCPPYVLLGVERNPGPDFEMLFEEGVDDFIRKPFWKEELLARVEAPIRLRKTAALFAATTLPAPASDPLAFAGWADIPALVGAELSSFACCPVEVVRDAKSQPPFGIAARISLGVAECEKDVRIAVGADHGSAQRLASLVLGGSAPPLAVLHDLLGEITNTAAGALKRAAPERKTLTAGLPQPLAVTELNAMLAGASRCFKLRVKGHAVELSFVVDVVSTSRRRVPAGHLREGMVLVKDLRSDAGLLLVPCGTRLTSTAAERVALLLGSDRLVEIAAAA